MDRWINGTESTEHYGSLKYLSVYYWHNKMSTCSNIIT